MNYNCLKARCIKNQLGIYKKGLQSAHFKKKKNSDPSIPLKKTLKNIHSINVTHYTQGTEFG